MLSAADSLFIFIFSLTLLVERQTLHLSQSELFLNVSEPQCSVRYLRIKPIKCITYEQV